MTNYDQRQREKTLTDRVVSTVEHSGPDDSPVKEHVIKTKLITHADYPRQAVLNALTNAVEEDRLETDGNQYWLPADDAS